MDEQLERLRTQLDALSRRTDSLQAAEAPTAWEEPVPGAESQAAMLEEEAVFPGQAEAAEPSDEDLSYGFETPGAEPAEAETYGVYSSETPEAVDFEAAAAEPESYWSGGEQTSAVHMETGPDYAEPGAGADLGEAEPPGGEAPGDERPHFTYGGEQAISERDEFTHGGEQAVSQPEEYQDEMDSLSYGAELVSPFEPPAVAEEEEEGAAFETGMPPAYEPLDAPAMEAEEEAAVDPAPFEPSPYQPAQHRPAEYEPAAVRHEPAEPSRPSASAEAAETTSRFVTEEIAGVLNAAEESAARILERARVQSEQQIIKSSRLWEEVRAEVARLASWRQGIEPVIQTVMTKVDGIRTQIEDVPERIREALAPMADSISGIDGDLAELAEACSPPLLLAPSELESDEGEGASDWDGVEGQEDHPSGRRNAG